MSFLPIGGTTMNSCLKKLIIGAAFAALFVPAITLAQRSPGGVTGGARLHIGNGASDRMSQSGTRSRQEYRSAPVIIRSERAPDTIAQAPTERRSFSYEPSQQTQSGSCGDSAKMEAPATERSTEYRRSFSYAPPMTDSSSMSRRYTAPRMRSSESSQMPRFIGPKAERNNYRN